MQLGRILDCVVNVSLPGRGEDGLSSKSMKKIYVLYRSNAFNEITKQRERDRAANAYTGLLNKDRLNQ